MGMEISGKDRIWGLVLAAVMLNFFIWGFQGSRPLVLLGIFPPILFVLSLAVPSKYQPHLVTFIVLLMAGVLVGVSFEKLFGNIPYMGWAVYTWPVIAAAVGVRRPFPVLKRYFLFLKMTATRDARKMEGREKWRKYRPQILSILAFGMGGTVATGILYLFSLYGPDVYGSRGMFENLGPVEYVLIWWIVAPLGAMRFGPFKAYLPKDRKDSEA